VPSAYIVPVVLPGVRGAAVRRERVR
jgi:hypothetical protein